MKRRYRLGLGFGIGLLLLTLPALGQGSPPAAVSALDVHLQASLASDTWVFSFRAWSTDGPCLPGVDLVLYGSRQGDEPTGALLASATTDSRGIALLGTSAAYSYYHLVLTSIPEGYTSPYYMCGAPLGYCTPQSEVWIRWDSPPPGTCYVSAFLAPPTPTQTSTVESQATTRITPTRTATGRPTATRTATPSRTATTLATATRTVTPSRTATTLAAATRTVTPSTAPAGEPSVRIAKVRQAQVPAAPVVVGDTITYTLAVTNTGDTPLLNLVVEDSYDQGCLTYLDAPGMPPLPGSDLRWEFSSLAAGDERSWDVILELGEGCPNVGNCALAQADGPQGQGVEDHACTEFEVAPPEPGLQVRKRLAEGQAPPYVGSTIHFAVEVQNTGGSALPVVRLLDGYDTNCLYFHSAEPSPNTVDTATGQITWDDIGPLAPGEVKLIDVYLLAQSACAWFGDCAHAFWMVDELPALEAQDCIEIPLAEARPIYLPLLMKQRHSPGPAPTETATVSPTATATPIATSSPTVTPTPTLAGTPGSTLLFADDFQDGDLAGWTATGGEWNIRDKDMYGALLDGTVWNMRAEAGSNIIFEGKLCPWSGHAGPGLTIRASADGSSSYDVTLDAVAHAFQLCRRSPYQLLDSYAMPELWYGDWHEVKIVAVGSLIQGYLDGVKRLEATDSTYASGQLGVTVDHAGGRFDDLRAWSLP